MVGLKRTWSRVGDERLSSNRHGRVEGEEEVGEGTTSLVKVRNKARVKQVWGLSSSWQQCYRCGVVKKRRLMLCKCGPCADCKFFIH